MVRNNARRRMGAFKWDVQRKTILLGGGAGDGKSRGRAAPRIVAVVTNPPSRANLPTAARLVLPPPEVAAYPLR